MTAIIIVLGFGLAAIIGSLLFACKKLNSQWNNGVCLVHPEHNELCDKLIRDSVLREINADYLERRNEFWYCLCQTLVIVVVITILAVLLILDKVKSEAALPVISGLGSFVLGKNISSAKNRPNVPEEKPAKQEE